MKLPYGLADFHTLRSEGYFYVDRTDRIRTLEETGHALLFLRPRRFGKSLWLRTLACYYDLRTADEHERLFGDLVIGAEPTPLAHRYFVLAWDFSKINPAPPPLGARPSAASRAEGIGTELHDYLTTSVETFLVDYREHLPVDVRIGDDAFHNLDRLLAAIRQTPYRLYLLIDEYDNFANEVMAAESEDYESLVHTDGPFKHLFKWVKAAMRDQGLERLFLTGVSPVVMSDVTSGLNVVESVDRYAELADLCGFTDAEVESLLEKLHAERSGSETPSWSVADALATMREWYNGYRFALESDEKVYNPTLVLYFAKHLQRTGAPPRQMLDANLAADEDKLEYIGRLSAGKEAMIEVIRRGEPVEIEQIEDRFPLRVLLERSAQSANFLGSYLYYFGMLTLEGETSYRTLLLSPPNQVIKKLYAERVLRLLLPSADARSSALGPARSAWQGDGIEPLLDFIEKTIFATLSNRDARWANELTVKMVFLTLLWNDVSYVVHSEPELERRYADLCLLRRADARSSELFDLLFEFKRLPLTELGMSGPEVKAAPREELVRLEPVKRALDQAGTQLDAYRRVLEKRADNGLRLRAWAVVALGFERLVARPWALPATAIDSETEGA